MEQLMIKLAEAKASVREEGTISADELEKELGLLHEEFSIFDKCKISIDTY